MDITGFIADIFTNNNLRWMLIAYLIGSIPSGYVIVRLLTGLDIRKLGSCSIGATNVLRVVKEHSNRPQIAKKLAVATMASDLLKGSLIICIAMLFDADIATIWAMAILVIFGHCYSVFLGFNGGKGVATTAGALLPLVPFSVLLGLVFWAVFGKIFRISSIASLLGIGVGILSTLVIYPELEINTHAPLMLILVFIFLQHLPNIYRLIRRKECKVI